MIFIKKIQDFEKNEGLKIFLSLPYFNFFFTKIVISAIDILENANKNKIRINLSKKTKYCFEISPFNGKIKVLKNFSIHIISGLHYLFEKNLSLNGEYTMENIIFQVSYPNSYILFFLLQN